jgi:hypothetical protein
MALLGILLVVAAVTVLWYLRLNQEVASEVAVRNPEGKSGTALVVYHPGRRGFGEKVRAAFVEGLISNGWRVEVTTASAQAPADVSEYDLLILAGPTYGFTPSRPLLRYLARLGDLAGKSVVTINTAMGAGERSNAILQRAVGEANGKLLKSLLLYTIRPNEDLYGINDAEEIASKAAREVIPAGS